MWEWNVRLFSSDRRLLGRGRFAFNRWMNGEQKPPTEGADNRGNLLVLALLAPFAGAAAGFTGVTFRLALRWADDLRGSVIAWAHGGAFAGFLYVVVFCAIATAIAAWL